jgi:F-type H+-transporting ATPase subunit b
VFAQFRRSLGLFGLRRHLWRPSAHPPASRHPYFPRDTINRLLTPDITTLWVVAFLLLCTYLLNSLVFKPILQIIDQRTSAVRGARELADSASHKATAAAAEYDQKLNAARAEVYGQMDEMRKAALDKRASLLASTHATVEQELQSATARVEQESLTARESLDRDANNLAGAIVSRVLGRAS